MVATETISSPIEQHIKKSQIEKINYRQKNPHQLCRQIHKTLLVFIQTFEIYITEFIIV